MKKRSLFNTLIILSLITFSFIYQFILLDKFQISIYFSA